MGDLSIEVQDLPKGIRCLRLVGAIDSFTFEDFDQAVRQQMKEGFVRLLVDLRDVSYVSSAGAGAIIAATDDASSQGGNLILLHIPPDVRKVFDMLGMTPALHLAEDEDQAIAALS